MSENRIYITIKCANDVYCTEYIVDFFSIQKISIRDVFITSPNRKLTHDSELEHIF